MGQKQSSIPPPTEQDTPAPQNDPVPPANESRSIETDPDIPDIGKPSLKVILEKLNNMDMCLHKDPWKNALQWSYILTNRTEEIIGCPVGSIMEMVEEAKTANEEIAKSLTKVDKDCGIVSVVSGTAGMGAGALSLTGLLLMPLTAGGSVGLSIGGIALSVATAITSLGASVTKVVIKKTQQRKLQAKTKAVENFHRLLKLSMEAIINAADSKEYHRQQVYASVESECKERVTIMDAICIKEKEVGARTDGNNPLSFIMEDDDEIFNKSIGTIKRSGNHVQTIVKMIKVIKAEGVAGKTLPSLMGAQEVTLPFKIAGRTALTTGSMGAKVVTSAFSALTIGMSALEIKAGYDAIKQEGKTELVKHYLKRSKEMAEETEKLLKLYYKLK